jgi:predicted RNA-binding protein Jag
MSSNDHPDRPQQDRRPRRDDDSRRDSSRGPRRDDSSRGPRRDDAAPRPIPVHVPEDKCMEAAQFLERTLQTAGWDVTVQLQYASQSLTFRILGPDAPSIAADADGRPQRRLIQALKTLIQRRLWSEDATGPIIHMEVADFLARQNEAFEHLSATLSQAARQGLRCELAGMTSSDRRILHQMLTSHADIAGQSEGLGIFRRLVIQAQ